MSIDPIRTWLAPILAAFALSTTVSLIAAAPPGHADASHETFYIDLVRGLDVYNQRSDQAWLQLGYKVCDAFQRGATEDAVTDTVQSDLGTSNYQAYRVVTCTELGLGCFSMKPHKM